MSKKWFPIRIAYAWDRNHPDLLKRLRIIRIKIGKSDAIDRRLCQQN